MRTKGKIATWNDDKGYGFVTPFDGGKQIFIHAKAFGNRNRRPQFNEVVTYSVSTDKRGRPCAANATLAGDKLREKSAQRPNHAGIILAVVFLAAIGMSVTTGFLPAIILIVYASTSLIAFATYALDKSAAQRRAWRTSEGTLLLLGLVGGWPGALIAQEWLRHKSKKTSFRSAFRTTVVMNCAVLAWLFTDSGKDALQSLLV